MTRPLILVGLVPLLLLAGCSATTHPTSTPTVDIDALNSAAASVLPEARLLEYLSQQHALGSIASDQVVADAHTICKDLAGGMTPADASAEAQKLGYPRPSIMVVGSAVYYCKDQAPAVLAAHMP
ncbi:hypothetical protein GCM10009840_23350 [Pseudolysinimonas kribbensis]|uniref:DUF732 domain-containing protein n=1 Tax=Pseudolysinimonas kribbensis TaxID=433641 RepID=A0ABQ6KC40_9MICO|nr:DUF732 domain-containing protein [Pseudolysinimonas kribbensis]GMA96918.1 hypothetical protein GCM10025881_37420 [Pseudolysinimonas kribbensis]